MGAGSHLPSEVWSENQAMAPGRPQPSRPQAPDSGCLGSRAQELRGSREFPGLGDSTALGLAG